MSPLASSAAFQTAQLAGVAEPKLKLLGVLRNIAAASEGTAANPCIAASGNSVTQDLDYYNGDGGHNYPVSGINDGDATHLNWGPASGADNGIGLGGWKSGTAASQKVFNAASDWNGGTQVAVKTMDASVELGLSSSLYEDDFEGLNLGALATQASWVADSSTGVMNVAAAAAYGGSKGIDCHTTAASQTSEDHRLITFGTGKVFISAWVKVVGTGSTDASTAWELRLKNGATVVARLLQSYAAKNTTIWSRTYGSAGSNILMNGKPIYDTGNWHHFVFVIDRTVVASTTIATFLDGLQVDSGTFDSTGIDRISLFIGQGVTAGSPTVYLDELRIGDTLQATGSEAVVFDLGGVPGSGRMTLATTGIAPQVDQVISGGLYSIVNNATSRKVFSAATTDVMLSQQFIPSASTIATGVTVEIARVGACVGNCWLEVRNVSSGQPGSTVYASSRVQCISLLSTSQTAVRFAFPKPFTSDGTGTTVYALVLRVDYAFSSSLCIQLYYDNAHTFSGGPMSTWNGTTWSTVAGSAVGFAAFSNLQPETSWATEDTNLSVMNAVGTAYAFQGFQVTYDCLALSVQALLKVPSGVSWVAGNRYWFEIQSDDGTGKPSNTVLASTVFMDPSLIGAANGPYVTVTAALAGSFALSGGVQYHLVLKGNWTPSSSAFLHLGYKAAGGYASGNMGSGTNAAPPVWSTVTGSAQFAILTANTPFVRADVAYSSDGTFTDGNNGYTKVTDNPSRLGSIAAVSFVGQARRYMKVKFSWIRSSSGWSTAPWAPVLTSATIRALWSVTKQATIDFGVSRTITRIELYAHPTEHGIQSFKLQSSPDGSSWTDITTVDTTALEARTKGGGATVSFASPLITGTGDYYGVPLTADLTLRYLRCIIYDNTDEWARIIEMRAMRQVDWSDRVISMNVSQDADFTLKQIKARTLNLSLRNDDGYLSKLGSSGGYNDQVGAGVKLLPYVNFVGSSDWIPQGVFFVDTWPMQSKSSAIAVTARDAVKLMNQTVSARWKVGWHHYQIVEYLANLCGISSTGMTLDPTAGVVSYFATQSVDAYSEAQKLAQACCFSELFFDAQGYLQYRAVGTTAGSTGIETAGGVFANLQWVGGPPVFIGGAMYVLASMTNGGNWDLRLAKYDLATRVWSDPIGSVISTKAVGHTGLLCVLGSTIYIADFAGGASGSGAHAADLYTWDGTTLTLVGFIPGMNDNPYGAGFNTLVVGGKWYIAGQNWFKATTAGQLQEIDLLTYISTIHAPLSANTDSVCGFAYEAGSLYLFTIVHTVGTPTWVLRSWIPENDTVVTVASQTFGTPSYSLGGQVLGVTNNGAGLYYLSAVQSSPGASAGQPGNLFSVTVPGGVVTTLDQFSTSALISDTGTVTLLDAGAMTMVNGLIIGGTSKADATLNSYTRDLLMLDTLASSQVTKDIGNLTLASSRLAYFVSTTVSGVGFAFGVTDTFRIFELQVRRLVPAQTVASFNVTSDPAVVSPFAPSVGATLEAGDDTGGQSQIINLAIIKSAPILPGASETLWSADGLPWGAVAGNGTYLYPIQLKDPSPPPQTVNITTTPGASATAYLDGTHGSIEAPQTPTLAILTTAVSQITALSVTGLPLVTSGTLISAVPGSARSLGRYGIQEYAMPQNDYIYSCLAQAIIGASIVNRFQDIRVRIQGLSCLALWTLMMFDRITVSAPELDVPSTDFWVTGFTHDWKTQTTSLKVVQA